MIIAIYAALLIGITGIVFLSFYNEFRYRSLILSLFYILTSAVALVILYSLMGNSLPVNFVTYSLNQDIDEGEVLFADIKEGEHILVLLRTEHRQEPMYIKLPLNPKLAENLQEGQRKQKQEAKAGMPSGKMKLEKPFSDGKISTSDLMGGQGQQGSNGLMSESVIRYENTAPYVPIPKVD